MRALVRTSAVLVCALSLGACQIKDDGDDLVAGKAAFVEKCGACHILGRAGTTGVAGPNLDVAFERSIADGMKRSTIEGVVRGQIAEPNLTRQVDPSTGKPTSEMPKDLVTGELAEDVAAYVAWATNRRGEDTGRLAEIGAKKAEGVARAEGGELEIPADPGGGLSYTFASAEAEAGSLTIASPNESSVPHNIALEGSGVDEVGPVVVNGGVSTIDVDVQAGEYTFYCSVTGHREAGMEGTLTVE